jgi:large subunit ribosomal protein L3
MYYPRVRARRISGRIRTWPKVSGAPKLLGFAGYKVGTTHLILVDNRQKSPVFGKEVAREVTVVETPPIVLFGYRAYAKSPKGLKSIGEVHIKTLPKHAERTLKPSKDYDPAQAQKELEGRIKDIAEIRALALTQPHKTGTGKKTPEVLEIGISGEDPKAALDYANSLLGKEIKVKDLFAGGSVVDVTAVTKGKGFAGAVKRFGVKIMPNWHKHRKGHRVVGAISPSKPHMMFTIPRPGKMGFHQRTEYNKLILKVGENPTEINVAGGYLHYGLVKGDHLIIEGSLPGPTKRLIRFKAPVRAKKATVEPPKLIAINLASKQGV